MNCKPEKNITVIPANAGIQASMNLDAG